MIPVLFLSYSYIHLSIGLCDYCSACRQLLVTDEILTKSKTRMELVGSLLSVFNKNNKFSYTESSESDDTCSYSILIKEEPDINTTSQSNSSIYDDNKLDTSSSSSTSKHEENSYYVKCTKTYSNSVPTLATGRRSKFMVLEGEAAVKREIRRKKNRESAKKLSEKRAALEQQLKETVGDLEIKHQKLLMKIESLESHKAQLREQEDHIKILRKAIAETEPSTCKHVECNHQYSDKNVPLPHMNMIKEEARPSTPAWQLVFSI